MTSSNRTERGNHGGARSGAGRKPFQPTRGDRQRVKKLVGFGLRQEEIAQLVVNRRTGRSISEATLRKHFAHELAVGASEANSKVAESLFRKATGDGPQSVTAAIWWTKCRMGWKERVVSEVDVKSGVLVAPARVSPAEWVAAAQAANRDRKEPGTEGEAA